MPIGAPGAEDAKGAKALATQDVEFGNAFHDV